MTDPIRVVDDEGGIRWFTASDVLALHRELSNYKTDLKTSIEAGNETSREIKRLAIELAALREQKPVAWEGK